MENKKTVTVLAPNGRRQTVKVNPNTTILQILEEVCKKQGLKSEEFDIKHHNKCLDTTTIIRFSGLPNNAQLELAQATKTRSEGTVILALQLENGTRLTGDFTPANTLWDVLTQLCPDESDPETNPVVIYMRREIYGVTSLKETNLRSLGLTGGRAILRLVHRSPEELRVQANVATPLPSKPVEEKPYIRTFKKLDPPAETPQIPESSSSLPPSNTSQSEVEDNKQPDVSTEPKPEKYPKKENNFISQFMKQEKRKQSESPTTASATKRSNEPSEPMEVDVKDIDKDSSSELERTVAEEEFVFLGTRNAMIFSQETAQAVPSEDLPDDFFELTISDAKRLLRDIKKARLEMDDAPLQTAALRNLQQSTQQLSQLNRYKQSIIRVNFPDHTVLQGTFSPVDTVTTVLEFVREYLEDKQMNFYLYTAPPKNILDVNSRLVEIGCVPNAILHFGAKTLSKDETYLRKDLTSKFTTPSVASLAAAKMRKQATRSVPMSRVDDEDESLEELPPDKNDVNVGASTSSAQPTYEDYPARIPKETEKVPKWFKPTK
ncbi:hypothetical protein ILUMI_01981 [Ignelater luminosus]|uniref:UBX domain-containing protein n=1 Tax=Ignelater luminosus TaxID=2038154 RepID=A0A8K0DHD7_IGNLU|nr:hypothetical protein ILUMI_01981 [Ignelater luminosus]